MLQAGLAVEVIPVELHLAERVRVQPAARHTALVGGIVIVQTRAKTRPFIVRGGGLCGGCYRASTALLL